MTRVRNLLAALAAGLIVALSAQPSSAALDNDDVDVTLILFFGAGACSGSRSCKGRATLPHCMT